MARPKKVWDTFAYLVDRDAVGGATWQDGCAYFGISRRGWDQRIDRLRDELITDPALNWAIPRPTRETGWKYRITDLFDDSVNGKADIRSGQVDDSTSLLGTLRRLEYENEVAYEHAVATEPAGKRSKLAKRLSGRAHYFTALITSIEADVAVL